MRGTFFDAGSVMTLIKFNGSIVFVASMLFAHYVAGQVAQPTKDQNTIDQQLFDDLKPPQKKDQPATSRTSNKQSDGEDIGKPSADRSPFAEIGGQMRQVELRLRQRDMSDATRQLQSEILNRLTQLLAAEEQRQKAASRSSATGQSNKPSGQGDGKNSTENPDGTETVTGKSSNSSITPDSVNPWGAQIWGVLPDRIQQKMRALGNEEFLPDFEEKIQQYYKRLADRTTKSAQE